MMEVYEPSTVEGRPPLVVSSSRAARRHSWTSDPQISRTVAPNQCAGCRGLYGQVNPSDPRDVGGLFADRPDLVFHRAAVVAGQAEADFQKGYRVNLYRTRRLLEAIRTDQDHRPRFVFAS
jgi:hypothetical protein